MTEQERAAVIDECIRAVLSVREGIVDAEKREQVETITGAACFRLLLLLKFPALCARLGVESPQ